MHLYNAWLPPPVADESKKERESFSRVVSSVKSSYRPDDPDSVYSTIKWVSVIDLSVLPIHYLSLFHFNCYFYVLFLVKFCFLEMGVCYCHVIEITCTMLQDNTWEFS